MKNKLTLINLRNVIKEEIQFQLTKKQLFETIDKKTLNKILTEEDGYTYHKIESSTSGSGIKIAVKGNTIYSIISNKETGSFEIGEPIGGGSVKDLEQNISNGISGQYLKGRKYIDGFAGGNVQAVRNYFTNRPIISKDYGFVFDENGQPSLVAFDAANNKPLFKIAGTISKSSLIKPLPTANKTSETPKSSSTTNITPNIAELNADFKFNSDILNNDGEFTKQLSDYLNEFTKPEFQYLKNMKYLPLMVAASASINSPNAKYDYELTVKRVNAVSKKIEEIIRSNPNIPKFQIVPMPLGQTDRFKRGDKTAVNRKVIVGTVSKVNTYLAKYPDKINKG